LEQNLQLYGRSPESAMRYQNPKAIRDTRGRKLGACEGRELTLLLVPQQMGLALELLATLIAGRQALSLHLDGTIVVERQAGRCDRGRFIWGASGPGLVAPAPGPALARPSFWPFFLSCLLACLLACFPGLGLGLGWAGWSVLTGSAASAGASEREREASLVPGSQHSTD
jgi:hypothetical protein